MIDSPVGEGKEKQVPEREKPAYYLLPFEGKEIRWQDSLS
jgi:hypothetical protein